MDAIWFNVTMTLFGFISGGGMAAAIAQVQYRRISDKVDRMDRRLANIEGQLLARREVLS